MKKTLLIAAGMAVAAGWFGAPAGANPGPLPQHQVRPPAAASAGGTWRAVPAGPHLFFGTIAALHGPVIIVRLRSGRLLAVDASAAIAHGDYSAPLFVGKIVSVDGIQRGVTFRALHVFRIDDLAGLGGDR